MTKMYVQFRKLEKQIDSSVHRRSGNWTPACAQLFATGCFVLDEGQDFWNDEAGQPRQGSVTGYIRFRDDLTSQNKPFEVSPLSEERDHFEFDIELPTTHLPWIISMISECEETDKVLTAQVKTRDETYVLGQQPRSRTFSDGSLFIRPFPRRIEMSVE